MWVLPSDLTAARLARGHVVGACRGMSTEKVDVARLLVSELVANAIQHGSGIVLLVVARDGEEEIELTRREVELLALLAEERGRIVSRRTLLREVWRFERADHLETRTVDMHVAKLRKKLGAARDLIETVRGEGYRLLA